MGLFGRKRVEKESAGAETTKEKVINDIRAYNEEQFTYILRSINLSDSRLPTESISKISMPEFKMTDWQLRILKLCQLMNSSGERMFIADTKELDCKLIDIAFKLSEAIEEGYEFAANTAVSGIAMLLTEVRNKVPASGKKEAEKFVRQGAEYAAEWVRLIDYCRACDRQKKYIGQFALIAEKYEREDKEIFDTIRERMKDDEFVVAINTIKTKTGGKTPVEKETQKLMLRKSLVREFCDMALEIQEQRENVYLIMVSKVRLIYQMLNNTFLYQSDYDAECFKEIMEKQSSDLAGIDEIFDVDVNAEDLARIGELLDDIDSITDNEAVNAIISAEAEKSEEEYYKDKYKTARNVENQADALKKEDEEQEPEIDVSKIPDLTIEELFGEEEQEPEFDVPSIFSDLTIEELFGEEEQEPEFDVSKISDLTTEELLENFFSEEEKEEMRKHGSYL